MFNRKFQSFNLKNTPEVNLGRLIEYANLPTPSLKHKNPVLLLEYIFQKEEALTESMQADIKEIFKTAIAKYVFEINTELENGKKGLPCRYQLPALAYREIQAAVTMGQKICQYFDLPFIVNDFYSYTPPEKPSVALEEVPESRINYDQVDRSRTDW